MSRNNANKDDAGRHRNSSASQGLWEHEEGEINLNIRSDFLPEEGINTTQFHSDNFRGKERHQDFRLFCLYLDAALHCLGGPRSTSIQLTGSREEDRRKSPGAQPQNEHRSYRSTDLPYHQNNDPVLSPRCPTASQTVTQSVKMRHRSVPCW